MKDGSARAHYFLRPSARPAVSEFHRLDATDDAYFLRARVTDPRTGVAFLPTNSVVLCETCGLVSLRETWEALGGCPNGHKTPAVWSARAALAAGDGASGALAAAAATSSAASGAASAAAATAIAPRPVASPRPEAEGRPAWLTALLAVVGIAALVVGGIFGAGLLRGDDAPPPVVDEGPPPPTGPTAVVAEAGTVEGALGGADFQDADLSYRDLYSFAADSSGRVLSVSVTSESFDPDLYVETPTGERVEAQASSEDAETGARTLSIPNLRGPGLYRLHVTSRQPEAEGAYTLRIRFEEPVRPLTGGAAPFAATLGEFSQQVDGFFRDTYRFRGIAEREHTVTIRSSAFAPTAAVTGPGGAASGETGRAGGSVTYTFTPEATGTYQLVVSSQSRERRGAYTVQLAVEAPPPEPVEIVTPLPGNGRPVSDSLAVGDTRTFSFQGRLGDRVRLEVRTDGFTPSLVLVGPDGTRTPAEPDGDRARISNFVVPTAGGYRVLVGAPSGGGEARVTLEQEAPTTSEDVPRLPGVEVPREEPLDESTDDGGDGGAYQPQPIGGGQE